MKTIAFVCMACMLLGASITQIEGFSFDVVFGSFTGADAIAGASSLAGNQPQEGIGFIDSSPLHLVRRFVVALFLLCLIFGTGFVGAGLLFASMARFKKSKPTDAG